MNDIFSEVIGKEKYGSVRMYGFGVCPSDVWENKSTWRRNQNEYIDALKYQLNELTSQVQILSSKQNNGNDISTMQVSQTFNISLILIINQQFEFIKIEYIYVQAPNHNDNVISSQLVKFLFILFFENDF